MSEKSCQLLLTLPEYSRGQLLARDLPITFLREDPYKFGARLVCIFFVSSACLLSSHVCGLTAFPNTCTLRTSLQGVSLPKNREVAGPPLRLFDAGKSSGDAKHNPKVVRYVPPLQQNISRIRLSMNLVLEASGERFHRETAKSDARKLVPDPDYPCVEGNLSLQDLVS